MSSSLFSTGLVPFEDLFSKPPNPMLGPSVAHGLHSLDREGCQKLTCAQGLALDPPLGHTHVEPSQPPSSPPLEPSPGCSPNDSGTSETLSSGPSPRWDFGDLFCKPPNPMLSPNVALSCAGTVACEPLSPASQSPRPADGQEGSQVPAPRTKAASTDGASCRPKKRHGQNSGLRPDVKRRNTEAGASAAKGKQPQEEDFAQLLEQYRRERETPEVPPVLPPPPPTEGRAKKGTKKGAKRSTGAKRKKQMGPVRTPRPQARPPAAQERAPLSQEFVERNTVVLGSQRVCKYFLSGRCVRGEQCRLDHNAEGLKFQQLCKFYVQGYCTRGDHCRFLHQEFPCKFFHTGAKCYQGDLCSFSHAPLTPESEGLLRAALASPAPAPMEAAPPPAPS